MQHRLRREESRDHDEVYQVIKRAFAKVEFSDQTEHLLVERLRKSQAFIPELSIVAEHKEMIIGHILLTRLIIENAGIQFPSLGLAPVSVLPDFQGKEIGSKLILNAHTVARELGYKSVMLIGHKDYYPRFGYKRASEYSITFPYDVPDDSCMAIELVENGLRGISGEIRYPNEFNG